MKSLDHLAILVTARIMTFLETLIRKIPKEKRLNYSYSSTYNHHQKKSTGHERVRLNRNAFPSPNARCGFVTGDAF